MITELNSLAIRWVASGCSRQDRLLEVGDSFTRQVDEGLVDLHCWAVIQVEHLSKRSNHLFRQWTIEHGTNSCKAISAGWRSSCRRPSFLHKFCCARCICVMGRFLARRALRRTDDMSKTRRWRLRRCTAGGAFNGLGLLRMIGGVVFVKKAATPVGISSMGGLLLLAS